MAKAKGILMDMQQSLHHVAQSSRAQPLSSVTNGSCGSRMFRLFEHADCMEVMLKAVHLASIRKLLSLTRWAPRLTIFVNGLVADLHTAHETQQTYSTRARSGKMSRVHGNT